MPPESDGEVRHASGGGDFSFRVHGHPGAAIGVALEGELDMTWADPLREGAGVLLAFQPTSLVLDLRGLTFIDSSGIAYLLFVQRACEAAEIPIGFIGPHPESTVRRVLGVTRVEDVLHLVEPQAWPF